MKIRAFAKINLTLDILGKRPDGYHEVRMILQQIGLFDEVTLERTAGGAAELLPEEGGTSGGAAALSFGKDNLMVRAAELLRAHTGLTEGVAMRLKKNIPVAAGLAGGSADAAAVLKGMNGLFSLGLSEEELCRIGAGLGADIPFCIRGGTMLCEGFGERLTPVESRVRGALVLAKPQAGISTKDAYAAYDRAEPGSIRRPDNDAALRALEAGDEEALFAVMANVLEPAGIAAVPEIRDIKDALLAEGARAAMMSGSGPTVFGIFRDRDEAERAAGRIRGAFPGLSDLLAAEF